MERMYTGMGQIIIAVAKIVIMLLLPLVAFVIPVVGIPIPGIALRGLTMFNTGNMLVLIPIIVYVAMILAALGSVQKFSWIAAAVALIVEFVFLFIPSQLLTNGDIGMLLSLVPAEYQSYVEFGLTKLARPGLGLYLNMGLTILYLVWHVIGGTLFGNGGSASGRNPMGGGRPSIGGNNMNGGISGGINPPSI